MSKEKEFIYSKYPKEKGYNRHFSVEDTAELMEAYTQEKVDEAADKWNEQAIEDRFKIAELEKENKQLKAFVTKFHNWTFEVDVERISTKFDELKNEAEQQLKSN